MRTQELPGQKSTSVEPNKEDVSQPSLKERLYKYKAFIVCLVLLVLGILCLFYAATNAAHPESNAPQQGMLVHLLRDIGIVLVTTGTVVFAADYITRKDFLTILSEEMMPLRQEVLEFRLNTLKEMEPLRKDVSSLIARLLEEVRPLKREIPSLSSALDDIRNCISLGSTMTILGIKQIHENRRKSNLLDHLSRVKGGSEVKLLGIIASEVSTVPMQGIMRDKVRAGCKFKILCLDPESNFVRQRAIEEARDYEDMKDDILNFNKVWRNFVERGLAKDIIEPGQVEFRYYNSTPRYFLFITDDVVIVGFYLGRRRGANGPHIELEIKETGIATAYIEHFDILWETESYPSKSE
jgi:hypothetical protein